MITQGLFTLSRVPALQRGNAERKNEVIRLKRQQQREREMCQNFVPDVDEIIHRGCSRTVEA